MLVDDHNLIREALRLLLENLAGIKVVADATDGRGALVLLQKTRPDVAVMDVAMPGLNGIEATRKITKDFPSVKVISLSAHSESRFILHMFKAGARGYVLKDCLTEELAAAIRTVSKGKIYISSRIADTLVNDCIHKYIKDDFTDFSLLTDRQRQVLQLLAEGKTAKQIAFIFGVSVKTIETYRQQLMDKLNIHSIAGLTKYAIREGMTSL